jgi:murein DD-endopeptidase MepM/ murein hydrolase activator NlpD
MLISPPFLPARIQRGDASSTDDPLMDELDGFEQLHGLYPIAFDRRVHGGIHLTPATRSTVHAVADGEVVAYRVCQQAYDYGEGTPSSNAGFVLLKHTTETGEGRSLTFYSLYMHLLDLSGYQSCGGDAGEMAEFLRLPTPGSEASALPPNQRRPGPAQLGGGQKVYRKDILGWLGGCHGQLHLHFEIFMTQEDFKNYFEQTQLGTPLPKTPESTDLWGHSYYVIPGGSTFYAQPPDYAASSDFPSLQDGRLDVAHSLYVEAYFHEGERYTRSWLDQGDGKRVSLNDGQTESDALDGYEYALYERATKYYPACPSDGYELLRFGRILSTPATLRDGEIRTAPAFDAELAGNPHALYSPNPRATWVSVRFGDSECGYIDLNDANIQKLSDADFPSFMGWHRISESDGLFDEDGLCDIDVLARCIGEPDLGKMLDDQPSSLTSTNDDALIRHLKRDQEDRRKLRGFICEATSEWDSSDNQRRYGKLLEKGGFYEGREADYAKFINRMESIQFWDKTPFKAGQRLWQFHPLQFIRHFRKCGWLSKSELIQTLPMSVMRPIRHGQWVSETVPLSPGRQANIDSTYVELNATLRKFNIAPNPWRMAAFLANTLVETTYFLSLYEKNPAAWYYPWDGRGFLQLTGPDNYFKYWQFLGREVPTSLKKELGDAAAKAREQNSNRVLQDAAHPQLTPEMIQWRADVSDSRGESAVTAGAYWAWTEAARYADRSPNWTRCVQQVTNEKKARVYYRSNGFGQVAAVVNFGHSVESAGVVDKVNGIVARFQSYTHAAAVLTDNGNFPDAEKQLQGMPDGFERRTI